MKLEINGHSLELSFEIRVFSEIVSYMKFYEPHKNMTLTKYLNALDDEDYIIDLIVDLVFYPYASRERKQGKIPAMTYDDIFVWVVSNPEKIKEITENLKESMPQAETLSEQKKRPMKRAK
jgi:hypothetical protein